MRSNVVTYVKPHTCDGTKRFYPIKEDYFSPVNDLITDGVQNLERELEIYIYRESLD